MLIHRLEAILLNRVNMKINTTDKQWLSSGKAEAVNASGSQRRSHQLGCRFKVTNRSDFMGDAT